MSGEDTAKPAAGARALAGGCLLLVLLGYALFLHHGLGPLPDGPVTLFSPRGFLIEQAWIEPLETQPAIGVAAFAAPAALAALIVFLLTGSAVARTLAVSAVVSCALFAFYGLRAPGPAIWNFFGWRGSAVMAGLALAVGATATAPLLARSWLRLPVAARVAVYLPIFVGVVAMLRNVTGTDPSLRFAISPWPVVPLFGMKIGSVAILGWLAGMAVAALGFSARQDRPTPGMRRAVALLLALLVPGLWFRLWHGGFPARGVLAMTAVAALLAGLTLFLSGDFARRGRHLAWGFMLAFLPLVVGEAWARWDYSRTREGTARVVIDALDAYYQKHDEYPERLSELVEGGLLGSLPRPQIGFAFLGDARFEYQSFGTGYNLEFSSPDWVQCAYNPAWSEGDWEDEDYEDDAPAEGDAPREEVALADSDGAVGEAWSCPSSPPELW